MIAQPCVAVYVPTRDIINQILVDMLQVGRRTVAMSECPSPKTKPVLNAQQREYLLAALEEEYDIKL